VYDDLEDFEDFDLDDLDDLDFDESDPESDSSLLVSSSIKVVATTPVSEYLDPWILLSSTSVLVFFVLFFLPRTMAKTMMMIRRIRIKRKAPIPMII